MMRQKYTRDLRVLGHLEKRVMNSDVFAMMTVR